MSQTTKRTAKKQTIEVTPELKKALVWAGFGLGHGRPARNDAEREDRAAAEILLNLAKQLGADVE